GTSFFTVANGNYMGFGGGTIGGDAKINVDAANFSTGALIDDIYNYGGASIGGNADISFNLTGDLTTQRNADFRIFNGGGTIGGNAMINATAASISTGAGGELFAGIDN